MNKIELLKEAGFEESTSNLYMDGYVFRRAELKRLTFEEVQDYVDNLPERAEAT